MRLCMGPRKMGEILVRNPWIVKIEIQRCQPKIEMSYRYQNRNVRFLSWDHSHSFCAGIDFWECGRSRLETIGGEGGEWR